MFAMPVVYVDIETTGGSFARSRIIEVAAIRVEAGKVVDSFCSLINPGTPLPHWITKLTGIEANDVVQAPDFSDIAYRLHQILDGAVFIAHNVHFDYSHVKRELGAAGYGLASKLLCTVRLSRHLYPQAQGHSLEKIIARHHIVVSARHRAYEDAAAIMHFANMAFAECGPQPWVAALTRQWKSRSLPSNLDESTFQPLQNKPGVYVFEDAAGQPIYVGKSVTLRNRVLSHFNAAGTDAKEMKIAQGLHKVRVIETGNELEALLLESKMIKELLPVHNRKLRRVKSHLVLVKDTDERGYSTIKVESHNIATFADIGRIYGVYTTRAKARHALEDKMKTFSLCPKLLGFDTSRGACFSYQLGKCRGACAGKESASAYNERVELALERTKVEGWPYKSAVVIASGEGNSIVVDKWVVLGYVAHVEEGEPHYQSVEPGFDIDTYRILRSYIKQHAKSVSIRPISASMLASLA